MTLIHKRDNLMKSIQFNNYSR